MRRQVKSSSVKAVSHSIETGDLTVEFMNGSMYVYKDVPPDAANGLLYSSSPGRYMNENIKGTYSHVRIK